MNNTVISKLGAIEIQTVSWCNSGCVVCPWMQIKDVVPKQNMREDTWNKVLEGISSLRPDRLLPYNNNEPLLDKNIKSRILDLRSISPQAIIEIATNGLLLSEELSDFLVNHTDIIFISLFGSDEESNFQLMGKGMGYNRVKHNILSLQKAKERNNSDCFITVVKIMNYPPVSNDVIFKDWIFWEDEGINTRYYNFVDRSTNVGDFNQRDHTLKACGCDFNRPNERTFIWHNGDVSFCCHDWRKEYIMGNLHANSLIDILNSEKYNLIRDMVDGIADSADNFLCKKCFHCKTSARE